MKPILINYHLKQLDTNDTGDMNTQIFLILNLTLL